MPRVGDWHETRRWLYNEKFAIKKGERVKKDDESHLALDGGRFMIPDTKNAEFLNRYAHSLFNGDWLYMIELKTTPAFYYMIELDVKKKDSELSDEEKRRIVRVIQGVMSQAFPEHGVNVVVSTAPPKASNLDDGTPATQSGMHLNWRIPVDIMTAWQLRSWIISEFETQLADIQISTSWSDAFDSCIYQANGLRMIGSRKAMVCPSCRGQSYKRTDDWGQICAGCQNVGRLDMGRPYELWIAAGRDGEEIPADTRLIRGDPMTLVLATTIRAIDAEGKRIPPVQITFPSEELRKRITSAAKAEKSKKKGAVVKPKQGADKDPVAAKDLEEQARKKEERRDALEDLQPSSDKFKAISEYLTREFKFRFTHTWPDGHTTEELSGVTHIKQSGAGDVYIVNTDNRYCMNKGGHHAHSTVFFVLRPTGCVQRCFCPKDSIQPHGGKRCSAFISKPHKLPRALRELIFSHGVLRTGKIEEKRIKLSNILRLSVKDDPTPYSPIADYTDGEDQVPREALANPDEDLTDPAIEEAFVKDDYVTQSASTSASASEPVTSARTQAEKDEEEEQDALLASYLQDQDAEDDEETQPVIIRDKRRARVIADDDDEGEDPLPALKMRRLNPPAESMVPTANAPPPVHRKAVFMVKPTAKEYVPVNTSNVKQTFNPSDFLKAIKQITLKIV